MKRLLIALLIIPTLLLAQDKQKETTEKTKVDAWSGATKKNKQEVKFTGYISGKVKDTDNKKALEFATVSLTHKKTNKLIEGTITDNKGRFLFEGINVGEYIIGISFIGFENKQIEVKTSKSKPDFKDNNITLNQNSKLLGEINIEEEKAIYETRIDKIIYNAEHDLNDSENDATDVLRKAPLLSVDLDGNVSLRGSKNIKFLVNGKQSSFFSSDVATALQMIPADQIKSVEVITSPGAKYDGEGDAGIVNIITKRKVIDGYKSTVSSAFGSRVNRQNANLSLGKGRFGLSARGGANYSWPREGFATSKRESWDPLSPEEINTLIDSSNTFSQWIGYRGSVNMFYDINAYNSIMSDIRIGGRNSFSNDKTTSIYNLDVTNTYLETNGKNTNVEWSTDYIKTFADNEEKELSISFQLGGSLGDDNIINYNGEDEKGELKYNTYNDEKEIEYTFQADYTHPFLEENKLEVGTKLINRTREIVSTTISEFSNFRSPHDIFNYNQQVLSTYISTDWQLGNDIGLKAGIRHEYTSITGDWKSKEELAFENAYGNILPSLTIAKEFSQAESLKLSYNNRISRPGIKHVNPNSLRTNNFSITEGNPNLSPASTQQLEMGYNNFGKKYQGSYSIYAKRTIDIIESYTKIIDTITTNIFENIGSSTTYGFNYYGSLRFDKANIRAGFNLYQYTGSGNIDNKEISLTSNLLYSYNFGGTYDLGKKWKVEGWGFFRSPSQTIQGTSTSFSMMSFGVKKDFTNKRGSLGFHIVEPFSKNKIFVTDIKGDNFTQYSERHLAFRSIGISFKYTFGKLNFKASSKKSNIKNDDVSEGENTDY